MSAFVEAYRVLEVPASPVQCFSKILRRQRNRNSKNFIDLENGI
jgi:hypothetical protein